MKTFFKNIFLKDKPESSKRFFGAVGFVAATIVICIFKQDLIDQLLYTSAALMGMGILDETFNKK